MVDKLVSVQQLHGQRGGPGRASRRLPMPVACPSSWPGPSNVGCASAYAPQDWTKGLDGRVMPRPCLAHRQPPRRHRLALLRAMGPGMVAGAADNDPTTAATLAVVGSTTGFSLAWLVLLLIPLLVA